MRESNPVPRGGADPRAWLEAQGAYARDLATFQATRPCVPQHDATSVLRAIEPIHALGFSWSMSSSPESTTITVRHVGGWEDSGYVDELGRWPAVLALLLGVVADDRPDWDSLPSLAKAAASAVDLIGPGSPVASEPVAERVSAAQEEPVEPDEFGEADLMAPGSPDGEVLPEDRQPLSESDKATAIALIKAMAPDARQRFQVAFRSHFNVDRSVKRISDHISQVQHQRFIADFIDELEQTAA